MEQWAMLIKDFDFPLDSLKWFFIVSSSYIYEVYIIKFINDSIIMITFEESTLITKSF